MAKHVFISYARAEALWAEQVETGLRAAGLRVWRDVDALPEERDLTSAIETALGDASHVVVCLTPAANKTDSWTRREVQWALLLTDPDFVQPGETPPDIIPVVFPGGRPFVNIATRPFIKLDQRGMPALVDELVRRIHSRVAHVEPTKTARTAYLRELYAWISERLPKTLQEIIEISVAWTQGAVAQPHPGALPPAASVAEAFERVPRLLVLGLPGSGKTTALLLVARHLVVAALDDAKAPLPVVATLAQWDRKAAFEAWLDARVPPALEEEKRVYLLDGLDELGNSDDDRGRNPRVVVLEALATTLHDSRVLITSRPDGYTGLGHKADLEGAVTLERIDETELLEYLQRQGAGHGAVSLVGNREIRDLLATPLGARLLVGAGERLRDTSTRGLIDAWVSVQMRREAERSGTPIDEAAVRDALGALALAGVLDAPSTRYYWRGQPRSALNEAALDIAQRAGIVIRALDGTRAFFHAALFDHFAIPALRELADGIPRDAAVALSKCVQTVLGARGADVFAYLVIHKFDSEQRKSTFLSTADFADPQYVPVFLALYSNNSAATDHWLSKITALGDDALPQLARSLNGEERLARTAAKVLGRCGESGTAILYEALRSAQPHVRAAALDFLPVRSASLGDLMVIRRLTKDPDLRVRAAATSALATASREDETSRLVALASDPAPEVREQALAPLGESKTPAAREALRNALADPVEHVRARAMTALVRQRALSELQPILLTETGTAVQIAAMAISEDAGELPTSLLVRLLDDAAAPVVRECAAFALERRSDALPALLAKLASGDTEMVRIAVLRALATIEDPRIQQALVDAIGMRDRAGAEAVTLLAQRAPRFALAAFEQAERKGWLHDPAGNLTEVGLAVKWWASSSSVRGAAALAARL